MVSHPLTVVLQASMMLLYRSLHVSVHISLAFLAVPQAVFDPRVVRAAKHASSVLPPPQRALIAELHICSRCLHKIIQKS